MATSRQYGGVPGVVHQEEEEKVKTKVIRWRHSVSSDMAILHENVVVHCTRIVGAAVLNGGNDRLTFRAENETLCVGENDTHSACRFIAFYT